MSKILIFVLIAAFSGSVMFVAAPRMHGEAGPRAHALIIGKGAVENLHDRMRTYLERQQITNISFGVWQYGRLVTEGDYGPVSETLSVPVSDTTIYRIRSMTKPVTAIGLLILMERGHFKLSDPITKYLPEFEDTEVLADYDADAELYTYPWLYHPTMAQLLSHTAGFTYWRPGGDIIEQRLHQSGLSVSPNTDVLVQTAAEFPYTSMPGAEWNYSIASDLQGAIIERITGLPLSEFLAREIFTPLQMRDTGFHVPADKHHRLSGVSRLERGKAEYTQVEASDAQSQSDVYREGGHGLYSTRADYVRFLNLLRQSGYVGDQQLLSPDTVEQFRTNAIRYRGGAGRQQSHGQGAGLGFGLGIGTIEDPLIANMPAPKGTLYWTGALGTWFWVDPVNDIVFIGMTQSVSRIEPDMMKTAMAAIYGEPVRPGGTSDVQGR